MRIGYHGRMQKTAIITGGNAGLGFEAARVLGREGWHVVIACRDAGRGEAAASQLRAEGASVEVRLLDLASLASVRRFAASWEGPIGALICNAGIQVVSGLSFTEDGYETTFATNHLGHFLLVDLLRPHLARVVVVASGTHDPAKRTGMPEPRLATAAEMARPPADTEDAGLAGRRRYTTSKLCNVMFAYELSRRAPELVVTTFDPGLMPGSGLARDYKGWQQLAWNHLLPLLRFFQPNVHTTAESGRALARLASAPVASGTYFEGLREIRSSAASYDEVAARELWEGTKALI
jgi:NAD(P)-dependent dehydrogenase (short-subunit alcohol dehydrogenase family)